MLELYRALIALRPRLGRGHRRTSRPAAASSASAAATISSRSTSADREADSEASGELVLVTEPDHRDRDLAAGEGVIVAPVGLSAT